MLQRFKKNPKQLNSTNYSRRDKTEVDYIAFLQCFSFLKKRRAYSAQSLVTFIPIPKAVNFLTGISLFGNQFCFFNPPNEKNLH